MVNQFKRDALINTQKLSYFRRSSCPRFYPGLRTIVIQDKLFHLKRTYLRTHDLRNGFTLNNELYRQAHIALDFAPDSHPATSYGQFDSDHLSYNNFDDIAQLFPFDNPFGFSANSISEIQICRLTRDLRLNAR